MNLGQSLMPLNDPATPGVPLRTNVSSAKDLTVDPAVAEAIAISKGPAPARPKVDPAVSAAIALSNNKGVFQTADEFAAASLGQEKLANADLGPYQRAKLAFLSDTEEERQKAFKTMFPEGDYLEIPTKDGPAALFRTAASEEFSKVDKSAMEKYKKEGLGSSAHEVFGDAAEFLSPASFQALADLAVFKGKGGVLLNTLKAGVSALAGETARQATQDVSGTSAETPLEQGGEVLGAGTGGMAGSLLIGGGTKLGKAALGRGGIFGMKEGAAEAEAAAARLGLPKFSADQLIESPLIERLAKQSSAVSRNQAKLSRAQSDALVTATKSLVNESDRTKLIGQSREVLNLGEDSLKALEANILPSGKAMTPRDLGIYLRQAHKEIDQKYWKPAVDQAYATARAIEDPDFDLAKVVDVAKKLKAGVWTPSAPIEEVTGKMPNGDPIIVRTQEPVRLDRLEGDIKGVVDDILAMDPSMPQTLKTPLGEAPVSVSRADRLKALIERTQDAAIPGPEGARRSNYVANEVRGALQDAFDNPVNSNPEFNKAWDAAKGLAKERFSKNEAAVVRQLVATETPEDIGNMLVQPGIKPSTLLAMKNGLPPKAFEQIRYSFLRRALGQKENLPEYLAQFDENALETLLPGNYKGPMLQAAKGFQELAKSGVPQALERHTQLRAFTDAIANQADTASIDSLYNVMKKAGGPQSDFGRSIRAAFLDKIIEESSVQAQASGMKFSSSKMGELLKSYNDRGLLKFLTPEDVNVLKDGQVVRQFMEATGADVGAAIEGTSVAKGIFLRGSLAKLTEYLQLASIGRLLTSDTGRKILIARGGAESMSPVKFASYIGATMSELARQNSKRSEGGEKGYDELERIQRFKNIREAASP